VFPATLFDFNGVLVNDEGVHLEAFREALAPLGIEVTERDYFERYLGFDDAGAFRAILDDAGRHASSAEIAHLIEAKRPLYRKRALAELPVFEGAAELVLQRAQRGPALIVSGALRDEIELGLSKLGVRGAIHSVVAAEDTRAGKPDPEGYELALRRLSEMLSPHAARRAIVIEDSLAGVQAAKAARLSCCAVTHTYAAAELAAAGADLIVEQLTQIDEARLGELYRKLYV
jgi:HAD superfamily hydrolase (TIGR01509 family)